VTRGAFLLALVLSTNALAQTQSDLGLGTDAANALADAQVPPQFLGQGQLNADDGDDFFLVGVRGGEVLEVELTPPAGTSFTLTLVDSLGAELPSTIQAGEVQQVSARAPGASSGVRPFFIHVARSSGEGSYSLEVRLIVAEFEAESGTLVPNMEVVSDASASGGAFVRDGNRDGITGAGEARYTFVSDFAADRTFFVRARVLALSQAQDSFFFAVDGAAPIDWHTSDCFAVPQSWTTVYVTDPLLKCSGTFAPVAYLLGPGSHELVVTSREGQSGVDRIWIQQWPPEPVSVSPVHARVGCDCESSGELAPPFLGLLLWALLRRRAKRGPPNENLPLELRGELEQCEHGLPVSHCAHGAELAVEVRVGELRAAEPVRAA
jgi:hypothetical protein